MEYRYSDKIVRLIQSYLIGDISETELSELEDWCRADDRNRTFFERVCQEKIFAKEQSVYRKIDERKAFDTFARWTKRRVGREISHWWMYAAIMFLPVLGAGVWKWLIREEPVDVMARAEVKIQPGFPRAVLVLDNGERVSLKEKGEGDIPVDEGVRATREEDRLVYVTGGEKGARTLRYNQLEVPRGGEYEVALSDGTRVYLNSATRMRYPVVFGGKERKVFLSGEAYFNVAKDSARAFLVETGGVEVCVYGTSFNINSHRDGDVQTVLVEGSVGVRVLESGEEYVIKPGEMAEFKKEDATLKVKEVNVSLYTDWKNGIFRFENQRLEDIMDVLSNWYDVDVFFQNSSLKELHFSGYMERYKDFGMILEAITLSTGVQFSIQGKTVMVSK